MGYSIMILKECKRAITSKTTLIAFGISLLLLLIGGWDYVIGFPYPISRNGTYLEKYLMAVTSWIAVLFPIIACIPYALSYRDEADSGFFYLYLLKAGKGRYQIARITAVFVSGFLAIFVPCLIWYFFMILVVGTGDTTFPIRYMTFFSERLYDNYPFLYGMIYTLNAGLQSGIFAVLGMGVSVVVKNRYVAILIPFAYNIFSAAVLEMFNPALNAITLFDIEVYRGGAISYWGIPLYDAVLLLLGINLYIVGDYYAHKG